MSAQKPASWAYSEEFVAETEVIEAARLRGAELGCVPVMAAVGAVFRLLAAAVNAKAVVEVGTGAGVSGLWLLSGMPSDGILTTINIQAEHQRAAKQAYAAAGTPSQRTPALTGTPLDRPPPRTRVAVPRGRAGADGDGPPHHNLGKRVPACAALGLNCQPNTAVHKPVRAALANSFGFGGTNASIVVARV